MLRINKALAKAGFCSRRKAERYILNGDVFVNGKRLTKLSTHIHPHKDTITIAGKRIYLNNVKQNHYLLTYKPIYTLSTVTDPKGRQTIIDLVPHPWKKYRLFPVGRLDFFSEGLLLLTNDGELTYKLTHPSYHIPKVYHVLTRGIPTQAVIRTFHKGMIVDNAIKLLPVPTRILSKDLQKNTCWLELTLYQGINRQIRKMFQQIEMTILKLIRIQHGPLTIHNLSPGTIRPLNAHEIQSLQRLGSLK